MGINSQVELLAATLFSETKDVEDARNIASVILNRTKRPQRFGENINEVIYQPNQFSGVNKSNEWVKAVNKTFDKNEEKIYKQLLSVASQAVKGTLEDTTNGADHYFNPKLVRPDWSKKMKKTTETKFHSFYKE